MTEHALVAACIANRKDNTPRLVYADWLEEFGTTDRHRAVLEWIRLTCGKARAGERRQRGEADWLRENFARLWPALTERRRVDDRRRFLVYDVKFLTNAVLISTLTETPRGRRTVTWVRVVGERGVIEAVDVAFTYASPLLATLATDMPVAAIRTQMTSAAYHTYLHSPTDRQVSTVVYRRPFELARLGDVWDALEGWQGQQPWNTGSLGREYHAAVHPRNTADVAMVAVDAALTRVARQRAGVPHVVVTPQPVDPPADPEPLAVPPRIRPT